MPFEPGHFAEHAALMRQLKDQHKLLLPLINCSKLQYLDVPVHNNIGDLLIYLGTLEFFKENNLTVEYSSAHFNYTPQRKGQLIVMHGGGNLGDLYEEFQVFRERIISENHDKRIIILPQSIHFKSAHNFARATKVFKQHPDLYICARDQTSFCLAKELGDNVILLPDMAHQLYPVSKSNSIGHGTLAVHRRDLEAAANSLAFSQCDFATDWPELIGMHRTRNCRRLCRALRLLSTLRIGFVTNPIFMAGWRKLASAWVQEAIDLYCQYDSVVTDRLHGHILACLVDIPNVACDNSYGKIFSYIRAWTAPSPIVKFQENSSVASRFSWRS